MPLDHDGLFAVIGKYVKTINTVQTYITALDSAEAEIYTILDTENLEEYYARPVSLPDQFDSFQTQVAGWISSLITNVNNILLDRDYVIDQLNLYSFTITDVLNALYDYMILLGETIESSVVSLGGVDTEEAVAALVDGDGDTPSDPPHSFPRLFVSRRLDGVNSPGNGIAAQLRYRGIESQLARSCTAYAKLVSNSAIGAETARLYSGLQAVEPYGILTEDPGNGPTLSNVEASNLVPSNYDFTEWSGDEPINWSMSGTVTTDYGDYSAAGNGPLEMKTAGGTAMQQITGLAHNTAYFIGAYVKPGAGVAPYNSDFKLRLRKASGTDVVAAVSGNVDSEADPEWDILFTFFSLPEGIDLTDIWVEVEYDAESAAGNSGLVLKVVVAPVVFWNGLAWAWWAPHHLSSDKNYVPLGHTNSISIINNDNGVFQTFFRKAFGVQLPTNDSPMNTIDDALAT